MTNERLTFEVTAQDGEARAGVLTTRRGVIETPVFMPVGTAGTVKGMRFEQLEASWYRNDPSLRRPAQVHRLGPGDAD